MLTFHVLLKVNVNVDIPCSFESEHRCKTLNADLKVNINVAIIFSFESKRKCRHYLFFESEYKC